MSDELLKKIERGLNELPTLAMDDIKAYGKAEYERGYRNGMQALQEVMWHEKDELTATQTRIEMLETSRAKLTEELRFTEIEHNRICHELKEQNKELMRENVKLKNAIEATHKGIVTNIDRIIELQTEVDSLKARRWAETDRAYKEGYEKGRVQEESKEPEWYDAEKCFPKLDLPILVEIEALDKNSRIVNSGQCVILLGEPRIIMNYTAPIKPYKILRWRYADE